MAVRDVRAGNETSESPPPFCVLFTLVKPTLDLSDTLYDKQHGWINQGPLYIRKHIYHIEEQIHENFMCENLPLYGMYAAISFLGHYYNGLPTYSIINSSPGN